MWRGFARLALHLGPRGAAHVLGFPADNAANVLRTHCVQARSHVVLAATT